MCIWSGDLVPFDAHEFLNTLAYTLLSLVKLLGIGGEVRHLDLVAEIVLHGVRYHEVAVGETPHESRRTETVGTVVREVTLTQSEETLDRSLELIVNPDTAHGVVAGGEDHHRGLVGVVIRDHLIHVEEVAVTVAYNILAKTLDGILEVEIYGVACTYAIAGIATLLAARLAMSRGQRLPKAG